MLPRDPFILLSLVNTKLRDEYGDLEALCRALDVSREALTDTLGQIGYTYDETCHQFR